MSNEDYPPLEDVWMDRDAILNRVWVHLNTLTIDPDTVLYFYCALEMRFFIESLFFELLAHYKGGEFTPRDLKTYRPQDYRSLILKLEPEYLTEGAAVLGIEALEAHTVANISMIYGQLGAYLHLPKQPLLTEDQNSWKLEMETFIIRTFEYLDKLTRDPWRNSRGSQTNNDPNS